MKPENEWKILLICIIVAIFLMIFLIVTVYEGEAAELHGYFEFGKTLETTEAVAKLELQLHHDVWFFHNEVYGGWETWMKFGGLSDYPYKDIYFIGDRIRYKPFYIEIEHFCNHPVYSKYNHEWWRKNERSGNALTTVSIGVEW